MLSEVDGILYAPPTHFDQFPEIGPSATITVNVNWQSSNCLQGYDDCTRTNYNTTTISSTQQSTQVQRSWSIGAGPPEDVESAVQGGLGFTYGQNFDKTTTAFAASSFGTTNRATSDDIVMFRAVEYTIWQYPLYLHNVLQGYPRRHLADGRDLRFDRAASPSSRRRLPVASRRGSIGQTTTLAMSSPIRRSDQPTSSPNSCNRNISLRSPPAKHRAGRSTMRRPVTTTTVKSQSYNLNFNFSFLKEIAAIGGSQLGASLDASFSKTAIQGSQRSFDQTTSLTGYLEDLDDEDWSYNVGPSAGWTEEGYFEIAYSATPGTIPGASNWILPQYYGTTKPDFTFTLKNRVNQTVYPQQFYSTDIFIDPACPTPGEPITLTARVRNYSIVGWGGPVHLTFFQRRPHGWRHPHRQYLGHLDRAARRVVRQRSLDRARGRLLRHLGGRRPEPPDPRGSRGEQSWLVPASGRAEQRGRTPGRSAFTARPACLRRRRRLLRARRRSARPRDLILGARPPGGSPPPR
ncbi:MAG: hypothetical protein KatS3mg060_2715 [Dehalococcoidia bacterium]|nr:MAG: hypothetical protein KatS3mg060_2715 [Dehalococcoidia bacterium]